MKVENIPEYYDVYHPYKAIFWRERLEDLKKGKLIAPPFVMMHPEAWCPHDCFFCAYRNSGWNDDPKGMRFFGEWAKDASEGQTGKPKGKLIKGVSGWSQELTERLPREMHECGVKAVEITGSGEPLAFPHIKLLFTELAKYNFETALVTNAQLLTPEIRSYIKNLKWMRFSMDSCTAETHSKVHGVKPNVFERCVQHISDAVREFPEAYLGISYIITKDNYSEVLKSAEFWKQKGVRSIRYSFEYEPTGTAKLTPEQVGVARQQISEARKLQGNNFRVFGQVERLDTYDRPNTDFHYCGQQMMTWNVGYDGKCYPCCIEIYKPNSVFGDLNKQSFKDVCFGDFRKKYVDNFDVTKCNNCWLRDKNIAIETLLAPEKRIGHVNFP